MDSMEAIPIAYKLWHKWVSARPAIGIDGYMRSSSDPNDYQGYDLDKIRECIRAEIRFHRSGKSNASVALMREVRGEAILLGKVRMALCKHKVDGRA